MDRLLETFPEEVENCCFDVGPSLPLPTHDRDYLRFCRTNQVIADEILLRRMSQAENDHKAHVHGVHMFHVFLVAILILFTCF